MTELLEDRKHVVIITQSSAPHPACHTRRTQCVLMEGLNASATHSPSQRHARPAFFFLPLSLRSSQLLCHPHPTT